MDIKKFIETLNKKGIPIPMITDPKTSKGSVSLTLVFMSFTTWLVCIFGKSYGLDGLDTGDALSMFLACAGLYFGRRIQKSGQDLNIDKE